MNATETENNLLVIDGCHAVPAARSSTLTRWSGQPRLRSRRLRAPTSVELHLSTNSDLPKTYGKKIKTAGGTYSECRGYVSNRYVVLPLTASALANELIKQHALGERCTIVLRGGHSASGGSGYVVSWVATVEDALHVHDTCLRAEVKAGKTRLVTEDDLRADDDRFEAEQHNWNCRQLIGALGSVKGIVGSVGLELSDAERAALESIIANATAAQIKSTS